MLLLLDGDVIAYDSLLPRRIPGDKRFVTRLDEKGEIILPEYSDRFNREFLEGSFENMKMIISSLKAKLYCDNVLMAVKGIGNYRDDIYEDYKANRKNKPNTYPNAHMVPALRHLAVVNNLAVAAHGREADDLLGIWAEECREYKVDFVVASIDKDLLNIPGTHWKTHHKEIKEMSFNASLRFFYEQLLSGDPVDSIPGLPRIGPKKAEKFLKDFKTEEEFQEVIVEQYYEAFGENWDTYLLSNGKMLRIQRHNDDWFTLEDWPLARELRGL